MRKVHVYILKGNRKEINTIERERQGRDRYRESAIDRQRDRERDTDKKREKERETKSRQR